MSGLDEEYGIVASHLPTEEEIADAEQNGHLPKLELVAAADFMAQRLIRPPEIIAGILHQGSKFCIGGASKACKTWALLDLALAVANGTKWMDFDTTQGKVLYLNFEIQEFAWQDRIGIAMKARNLTDLSNLKMINLRGKPTGFKTLIPQVIDAIRNEDFCLTLIDPIYKLYGSANENDATDVAELLTAVERLATESKVAVAYASHFSKGNQAAKEAMDRVSGSGVFARDPDSLMILTKHAQEDAFTVEPILRNFAPVSPFVVKWQFPLLTRDESLDPQDLKKPGGRPVQYNCTSMLEVLADHSLSTTEWCKNCSDELGMSRRHFFNLLKTLESDGLILKSKINGKWVKCN